MKILVTGSAGFIAGYVVKRLLDEGHTIVGIDNYSKYGKVIKDYDNHPEYYFVEGDASDEKLIKDLIKDCDQMICLAALVGGIQYFHSFPYDILSKNEKLTYTAFDSAIWAFKNFKFKKINIVSSSMVYENTRSFPTKEENLQDCIAPSSSYGFQKLCCEYFAKAAYRQYKLPYTIIRPFNCVGIGEYNTIKEQKNNIELTMSHVVPDLIKKVLKGQKPLEILGDGNQIRHYTYGEDIAEGFLRCIEKKEALNQEFNISTPEGKTVLELAELIWKKINKNEDFNWKSVSGFEHDVQKRIPDISKAEKLLGFRAETNLEDILEEIIQWVRKYG